MPSQKERNKVRLELKMNNIMYKDVIDDGSEFYKDYMYLYLN